MALGTPVAGAAAYSAQNGTTVSPAYPAGILATDAVLLFVGQKPSTANGGTVTTPTNWTLREEITGAGGYGTTLGADVGNTNLRVYSWNTPVNGQTGNLAVTLGVNNISWAFMVRVPTGGGTLSYGSADGQRTTTPTSPMSVALTNGASATAFQSGDLALWAMCIPTDVTTPAQFSAQSITATGATFATAVEINEPDSATGNDIGGFSAYALTSSGTSSTAPTVTVTLAGTLTNVRGPVALVRIREAALAPVTGDLDATENGPDTFLSTGDVLVEGALAATETGPDIFAATGTVTDPAITGTLAATEVGSDTLAATGDILVEGSLAATEIGSDVFAATAKTIVKGSLSVTEIGSDAFAATGNILVEGSLAATEVGSDVFAATGEVANQITTGTMAAVEVGSDTLAATGDIIVQGSLAATEVGSDTFAATATVLVQGSLAATEVGSDTFAASGTALVQGTLAATETGSDTFAASGTVTDPAIVGTLAATEVGSDTLASSGKVLVIGELAATDEPDTFAASGVVLIDGSFAAAEVGSDIFVGSGENVVGGIMTATEVGSDTLGRYVDDGYVDIDYVDYEIPGKVLVQGSFAASEVGSDVFAATGFTITITGDLAATETGSDTFAANGTTEQIINGRARGAVFTPTFQVNVTTRNPKQLKGYTAAVNVKTTSSANVQVVAHKAVQTKSRKVRFYKGVSAQATLRGSKIQTSRVRVVTGTTFAIKNTEGAAAWTRSAKIYTSTPAVVQFKRSKAKIGTKAVQVTAVMNPTDQELMAMAMLLRAQKLQQIKNIRNKI